MFDLHEFAARLLDLPQDQVEPTWELIQRMYQLISIQHRAIGLALDKLQKHEPGTGFTFAARHGMALRLVILREAYAAVSSAERWMADDAKRQLDEITPDPDQFTPDQWFHEEKTEAARIAGFAPDDLPPELHLTD